MTSVGVTADTGFLIGLERHKQRAMNVLGELGDVRISVPVAVVAEWWRASRRQAHVLELVRTEPMTERLAKVAGEALAAVPGATVVDAIVMASAAQRGDAVYTSDFEDLTKLRAHFPEVRIFSV
jgi:hypothetical protein